MGFDDENEEIDIEQRKKMKNLLIGIIVVMLLLLCAAVGIYLYAQNERNKGNKFATLDQKKNKDLLECFVVDNGTSYVEIKKIGPVLGYKYRNGEYGKNNEKVDYCYLENEFEAIEFHNNDHIIKKFSLTNKDQQPQEFDIQETVKLTNDSLYLPEQGFKAGLEILFTHNVDNEKQNESFVVYTSKYLATVAEASNESITITEDRVKFDKEIIYNNEKAVLDDFYIVDLSIQGIADNRTEEEKEKDKEEAKDEENKNTLYGVVKVDSSNSKNPYTNIITPRYSCIKYLEGTKDFMCTTKDGKVGIIGSDGKTKIKLEYESISIIDVENGLYLVKNGDKQGVVDSTGKVIVYEDFAQIGLDDIKDSNVTNKYVFYNAVIPVKDKNNKWGLISTLGEYLTPMEFDGIGCFDSSEQGASSEGVVLIPDLNKGIVVEKDQVHFEETTEGSKEKKEIRVKYYGVLDYRGEKIVDYYATSIFKTVVRDQATYYCITGNESSSEKIDLVSEYIKHKAGSSNKANIDLKNAQVVNDINADLDYNTNSVQQNNNQNVVNQQEQQSQQNQQGQQTQQTQQNQQTQQSNNNQNSYNFVNSVTQTQN